MSYPNIALTGKLRSGKTTVERYLVEKYNYTAFAFGDELKRYAHELFGKTEGKPRELYQWFGQTMRERDPNIWARKCFDAISIRHYNGPGDFKALITDMRQPNEHERCKAEGYVIIRIIASESCRLARAQREGDIFTLDDLRHDTERHVDMFEVDYDIDNNGTLDDLYKQVDKILTDIKNKGGGGNECNTN